MAGLQGEIQSVDDTLMELFNKGDLGALSLLYTEDCKLMPPNSETVIGRDGVKAAFGGVIAAGGKRIKLVIKEVGPMGAGDTAYERGQSTLYREDRSVFDEGKYVVIWKKIDGRWFLYIDIFNSRSAKS